MSRTAYKNLSLEQKAAIKKSHTKYHRTPKGFLSRLYKNLRGRTEGIQKIKAHLYKGLYLLPREDFYNWALNNESFKILFVNWQNANYDQKITPSLDRIDSNKGYYLDNIRWLTHAENSRLGAISRWQKQ